MDIVSLLLFQPNDQIRLQCLAMNPLTLARFTQTNKRIRDICGDILVAHKEKYEKEKEKSELLNLFTIPAGNIVLFEKEDIYDQFHIGNAVYPPDSIEITIVPKNEAFADILDKIPNIQSFGSYFVIRKDLLSDEMKIEILRMAKKLGYTEVSLYNFRGGHISTKLKSLNDFQYWLN